MPLQPPHTFSSVQEELDFYKASCDELSISLEQVKAAFDEFQADSKELEEEQDGEIERLENANIDLKSKVEAHIKEIEEWKNKYHIMKRDSDDSIMKLQQQVKALDDDTSTMKIRIRDLEQENEELVTSKRILQSNTNDFEAMYNKTLEKLAIAESELEEKIKIEEEAHRLKDELRDLQDELSFRLQHGQGSSSLMSLRSSQCLGSYLSTSLPSATTSDSQTPQPSPLSPGFRNLRPCDSSPMQIDPPSNQLINALSLAETERIHGRGRKNEKEGTRWKRNSVVIIEDMMGRVRTLESRLKACRKIISPYLATGATGSTLVAEDQTNQSTETLFHPGVAIGDDEQLDGDINA